MKKVGIKKSLIAIFLTIIVLCGFLGLKSLVAVSVTNDATVSIATHWLPSVKLVDAINTATSDFRVAEGVHIMSTSESQMSKAEADQKSFSALIEKLRLEYEPLISSDRERLVFGDFKRFWSQYLNFNASLLKLSGTNMKDEAATLFKGDMHKSFDDGSSALAELVKINEHGANDAYMTSQSVYGAIKVVILGAFSAVVAILLASMYYVNTGISKPINSITSSMTELAKGNVAAEIPFLDRGGEIGAMASAVEVFRQTALGKIESDRVIEANRSQSEKERMRAEAADRLRVEQMAKATAGLGKGLDHLSRGDLTFQLVEPFAEDFEVLRADFNSAVGQLSQTLRAVAEVSGAIDNGSQEISSSANDLSRRTEQQAASLEETAAALDQITVNVANSSRRADEARTVAVLANESAAQSGTVVANAIDAMQKIEQSSNEISNIIGVIDEIAFQTNLLALNAGVEAARAGDAGKGFAVVAQEVRELAQRSAKAAKEIKDLIRNSSVQVQSGVKLVSETGDALKTIESYIITVNQHMDSIATSAKEQSVGLGEVNTAVNQMDQVTQQNAAMVEETSAASASLANESVRLRELISQFQLGGALQKTASALKMAEAGHSPVASPAKRLVGKIANAFSGNAAPKESWEEF